MKNDGTMKYDELYLERKERWKTAGLWKRMARSADNLSQSEDAHETETGGDKKKKKIQKEKKKRHSRQTAEEIQTYLKFSMFYLTQN